MSARLLASLVLLLACVGAHGGEPAAVSQPGQYRGYSSPTYEGWLRTSLYITVRDGTRLAADIFRPATGGQAATGRLPVIWSYDRYHRADLKGGRVVTEVDGEAWLQQVIRHGYVVAIVDARGAGASFGQVQGAFTPKEAQDVYDVTEWLAAQPWSSGRIGMFGRSYMGTIQYLAAGMRPPHLKAIFPEMAMFDLYSFVHSGGILRHDFLNGWSRLAGRLDRSPRVAPVEGDATSPAAALKEHEANRDILDVAVLNDYRDSRDAKAGAAPYVAWSPAGYLARVNESGVAIYHLAGWHDIWTRDAFQWFKNLRNPQKLIVGAWFHDDSMGLDLAAEHLRWYDYWLKGIDNGVMKEAPIHFRTMGAATDDQWRAAEQWPLPNVASTKLYFQGGPSTSVRSINDGLLGPQTPSAAAQDEYRVDYNATSGTTTRWSKGYLGGGLLGYADMAENDQRGLTYTTPPLAADMEVTGHPVLHLWVNSSAPDGDFFVYLEDVSEGGRSRYVTEGLLRASHRRTAAPPFDNLGLPYHRGNAADVAAPTGAEPMELTLDLQPTSYLFGKGHRLRVTVTGADKDNAQTPVLTPAPTVSVRRGGEYASYITLPIVAPPVEVATLFAAATPAETAAATVAGPQPGSAFAWRLAFILILTATTAAAALLVLRFAKHRV